MKEISLEQADTVVGGAGISFRNMRRNVHLVSGSNGLGRALRYLGDHGNDLTSAQAKRNYAEYRRKRDSDGSAASRARSRSISDMNSPGDQRSNDKIGGR